MKRLSVGLIFFAATISPAAADTLQNAFGNTITITTPDGAKIFYHMNADRTYEMIADGVAITGKWELAGNQVCLTPNGGEKSCTPYVADKVVGDTWTQSLADGAVASVALTAGR